MPLRRNQNGLQEIDGKNLLPGFWKVRVKWESGGAQFFTEATIVVPEKSWHGTLDRTSTRLVGSLHCAEMCGPLALAIPGNIHSTARFLLGRLAYNLGRISTYCALGAVFGLIGKSVELIGLQRWISLGLGILILLILFAGTAFRSPQNREADWEIEKRFYNVAEKTIHHFDGFSQAAQRPSSVRIGLRRVRCRDHDERRFGWNELHDGVRSRHSFDDVGDSNCRGKISISAAV